MRPAVGFLTEYFGFLGGGPDALSIRVEEDPKLRQPTEQIAASLARIWAASPRDEHGRTRPIGLLHEPFVDGLAHEFLQTVRTRASEAGEALLRKWPWQHGRTFAVALSHDVDLPVKWRAKTVVSYALKRRDLRGLLSKVRGQADPWWTYDSIRAIEKSHRVNSTYFLAAGGRHPDDPTYQIESSRMKSLVRELKGAGSDIGLHGSYRASEDVDLMRKEKRRFERATGLAVDTYRQHFLRFHPESPERLNAAGFRYDSSLGTEFSLGFLDGVSVPHSLRGVLELPVSAMDTCLLPGSDVNRAYSTEDARRMALVQLLANVRKVNGLLVVDWHPNTFAEEDYPGFRELYELILRESQDAYRAGVREVGTWWEHRRDISPEFINGHWEVKGDALSTGFTLAVSNGDLETGHRVEISHAGEDTLYSFTEQGPWEFSLA